MGNIHEKVMDEDSLKLYKGMSIKNYLQENKITKAYIDNLILESKMYQETGSIVLSYDNTGMFLVPTTGDYTQSVQYFSVPDLTVTQTYSKGQTGIYISSSFSKEKVIECISIIIEDLKKNKLIRRSDDFHEKLQEKIKEKGITRTFINDKIEEKVRIYKENFTASAIYSQGYEKDTLDFVLTNRSYPRYASKSCYFYCVHDGSITEKIPVRSQYLYIMFYTKNKDLIRENSPDEDTIDKAIKLFNKSKI